MAFQRDVSVIHERFESILANAVTAVKTEEDPLVLNEYKKLFKKNVPLTLRSYVASYIVKQLASGIPLAQGKTKPAGRAAHASRSDKAPKERTSRVVIDADAASTIFIGIGRSRGVFPRDLIALICQRVPLERERVGDIRVLDNYSFVQVYSEDADKIIEALNGSEYRSRKLTVSRSRKKEEDAKSSDSEDSVFSSEPEV